MRGIYIYIYIVTLEHLYCTSVELKNKYRNKRLSCDSIAVYVCALALTLAFLCVLYVSAIGGKH